MICAWATKHRTFPLPDLALPIDHHSYLKAPLARNEFTNGYFPHWIFSHFIFSFFISSAAILKSSPFVIVNWGCCFYRCRSIAEAHMMSSKQHMLIGTSSYPSSKPHPGNFQSAYYWSGNQPPNQLIFCKELSIQQVHFDNTTLLLILLLFVVCKFVHRQGMAQKSLAKHSTITRICTHEELKMDSTTKNILIHSSELQSNKNLWVWTWVLRNNKLHWEVNRRGAV